MRRRPQALRRRRLRKDAPFWARIAFVLTIAAFAVQNFVTQTHVHFTPDAAAAIAAGTAAQGPSTAGRVQARLPDRQRPGPSEDDPANCPLCQEFLYAGNYVAPADIVLLPPTLAVSTVAPETPERKYIWAASHSWQGRAPPRA